MHFLTALSAVLTLVTLSTSSRSSPRDDAPASDYVPLETYTTFESPPPAEKFRIIADAFSLRPADLYALSVYYTYDTLPAAAKDDLAAHRQLLATIDAELYQCQHVWPFGCWALVSNGHRRETRLGWREIRLRAEWEYDQRMKYVEQGHGVAQGVAGKVLGAQEGWRLERLGVRRGGRR